MHEFSIAEAIVRTSEEVLRANGGGRAEKVQLRIGELRQVVPDALTFAFDILKENTLLADASLEWETVPAQVRCRSCGMEYHPKDVFWECPSCGAIGAEVVAGEELEIVSITLAGGSDGN
ncbi:MAG: hydrogenase maturation nickel metallochaperone HypA [Chthonomonadetes bacterium]|nr:hydrogenase maturation nickel metallochaperone HypA [Chthonomonadetes bacterium]